MQFKTLEDKCLYYRGLTDYKLIPNSYTIVMLDGRAFSHLIKNKYKKPFDYKFIDMMNETAKYVCQNVQGAKFAYVQSDEISIVITDFDTPESDSFFGYRLCKMQSIIASLATAKFNQLTILNMANDDDITKGELKQAIEDMKLAQFDCKAWTVPSYNDMFAWLLYRQIDCIRNSKQQTAQTYLPYKELVGLTTDKQIELLKEKKGIDWNDFDDCKKFGRFVYRYEIEYTRPEYGTYIRNEFHVWAAFPLMEENGRVKFEHLNKIPKMN